MNAIRLLVLAAAFHSIQAAAGPMRPVDVESFDVAGVRLGMSKAEAVAAISKKLGVGKNVIKFEWSPQANIVTNTKEPKFFTVSTGSAEVMVSFEPRIPYDKNRPTAVSVVTYKQPRTQQNNVAIRNAAFEKYGQPTDPNGGWCLHPHPNPGIGCSQVQGGGPSLMLMSNELVLRDPRYFQALLKYSDAQRSAKPTF